MSFSLHVIFSVYYCELFIVFFVWARAVMFRASLPFVHSCAWVWTLVASFTEPEHRTRFHVDQLLLLLDGQVVEISPFLLQLGFLRLHFINLRLTLLDQLLLFVNRETVELHPLLHLFVHPREPVWKFASAFSSLWTSVPPSVWSFLVAERFVGATGFDVLSLFVRTLFLTVLVAVAT